MEEKEAKPIFDLTMVDSGDTDYLETIKSLCDRLAKGQNSVLSVYWEVGAVLHGFINDQLESDETRNVSEVLRGLSEDIHTVSGGHLEYSDSTLRKMLTFRESISEVQLVRLKTLGVPVSKALSMCIKDVTDDDRDEIIEELEAGTTNTSQIGDRIKELCPVEEREEARGGAGPFQTIKKFNTSLDKLSNLTEDELTMYTATVMGSEEDDARVQFINQLRIAKNKIASLQRVFGVLYDAYELGEVEDA